MLGIAVVGSRGFNDYKALQRILNKIRTKYDIDTIISGGANGVDKFAEKYAHENNLKMIVHPANWDKYGKRAGYIRNVDIWNDAFMGLAIWDGKSPGTKHSFDIAKKQNKQLIIYNYTENKFMENK